MDIRKNLNNSRRPFLRLKSDFRNLWFGTTEEVKFDDRIADGRHLKEWYENMCNSWVDRQQKCNEFRGEYFEKL